MACGGEDAPEQGAEPERVPCGKDAGRLDEYWFFGSAGDRRKHKGQDEYRKRAYHPGLVLEDCRNGKLKQSHKYHDVMVD